MKASFSLYCSASSRGEVTLSVTQTHPFALTSAAAHTLVVGFGIAAGKDTLKSKDRSTELGQMALFGFALTALLLGLAFDHQFTPVNQWARAFHSSSIPFALFGATSVTAALCLAMCLPTYDFGLRMLATPLLPSALTALAITMHLCDCSASTCLYCFAGLGAVGKAWFTAPAVTTGSL